MNNSCSNFLSCLPLQLLAFDIVPSVIQHLFQLYSYYIVDMYTQMNRCSAHKIDNCSWLFHLSLFAILDCAFILELASVNSKPFVVFWYYRVVFSVISLRTFLLNFTAILWGMYILVSGHVQYVSGYVPCKKSNSYVYWLYLFVLHESLIPS